MGSHHSVPRAFPLDPFDPSSNFLGEMFSFLRKEYEVAKWAVTTSSPGVLQ